jgi:hypothetical protein
VTGRSLVHELLPKCRKVFVVSDVNSEPEEATRTALGPTQPPIQWVAGALSLGVKQPGREADHSPLSSAEVKNA